MKRPYGRPGRLSQHVFISEMARHVKSRRCAPELSARFISRPFFSHSACERER